MLREFSKEKIYSVFLILTVVFCIASNFGLYLLYYCWLFFCFVLYCHAKLKTNLLLKVSVRNFYITLFGMFIAFYSCSQRQYTNILKFAVWAFIAMIGYCFITLVGDKDKIGRIIVWILAICSIEGLIQFFTHSISFSNYLVEWGDNLRQGVVSIFLQHIVWGHMLVIGIVFTVYFFSGLKQAILLLLFFVNLYASQCRSAWIACIAFVFLLFIRLLNRKHFSFRKKSFIVFILSIIISFFFLIINRKRVVIVLDGIMMHLQLLLSGQARYRFNTVFALIRYRFNDFNILHHLFGSGYGSSSIALKYYNLSLSGNRYVVDNQIVSIYFEFGIIAFLFFVYLFVESIFYVVHNKGNKESVFSIIYIINFLMSCVYESFGYTTTAFLFFFVMGAKIAQTDKSVNNL